MKNLRKKNKTENCKLHLFIAVAFDSCLLRSLHSKARNLEMKLKKNYFIITEDLGDFNCINSS